MELHKQIIPETLFQKVIIGLMIILAVASLWTGFTAFQRMHFILEKDVYPASKAGVESYFSQYFVNFGSFTFTKSANLDTSFTYVTLKDLTLTPPKEKSMEILSSTAAGKEILGLSSHPSFTISESQRSFWSTQIYLEIGFIVAGIILLIFAVIWITSFQLKDYRKLFTERIYKWVLTLFFLIFTGFMVDALLYARKINFLNAEFGMTLSPAGGISPTFIVLLLLLLFLLIFVRKGISLQNEQDLTV